MTNAIDHHVGKRIRRRRRLLGLTQQQLAQLIGVTYQQALFDFVIEELGGTISAADYPEGGAGRIAIEPAPSS